MRWYCNNVDDEGHKCWATFPCAVHSSYQDIELEIKANKPKVIVNQHETTIVLEMIQMPCGHRVTKRDPKFKNYTQICPVDNKAYKVEIQPDCIEFTRI